MATTYRLHSVGRDIKGGIQASILIKTEKTDRIVTASVTRDEAVDLIRQIAEAMGGRR